MQEIALKIIKVILSYFQQKKEIDEEFFHKITEIIVSERSLNNEVRDLLIESKTYNKDGIDIAYYDHFTKIIEINTSALDYSTNLMKKVNGITLEDDLLFTYLEAAFNLIHELEHANQEKIIRSQNIKNPEGMIIKTNHNNIVRMNFMLHKLRNGLLTEEENERIANIELWEKLGFNIYQHFYQYSPIERLANVHAFDLILTIIKELPIENDIYKTYLFRKCTHLINGYTDNITPTPYFFEQLYGKDVWRRLKYKINKKPELNTDERFALGIQVSEDEKEDLTRKIVRTLI